MKKNIITMFAILLFIPGIVNAKTNEFSFKNYGGSSEDEGRATIPTNDGGYVIAGYTKSSDISDLPFNGSRDAIIVKYDKNGKINWQKNYGGTSGEYFMDVTQLEDGGLVAVGSSASTTTQISNNGGDDALVVKYDANGKLLWEKNFGYSAGDRFEKVLPTVDGGVLAVGEIGYTGYTPKLIIVKYSKDGKQEWAKELDEGTKMDDVTITSDNCFTVAHHTEDEFADYVTSHIMKIKNDGTVLWNKEFKNIYYFTSINSTANGGSVLIANDDTGSFLLTIDKDGKTEKQINYSGEYSTNNNKFNSLEITKDNGYIVVGKANSDGVVLKFDQNGALKWEQKFGGSGVEEFIDFSLTPTDGVIVAGTYKSTDISGITNQGSTDIIIIHYDKSGKKELEKVYGGTAADSVIDVTKVTNSKYVILGISSSSSIGGISTNGNKDIVISELNFFYVVTKEKTENGTFEVVEENDQAKISVTPAKGYEMDTITIKDSSENTVEYTEKDGEYYTDLIDDLTVSVTFKKLPEEPNTEEEKEPEAPYANSEEVINKTEKFEIIAATKDSIKFKEDGKLKENDKLAVWIYSTPKFLGYFNVEVVDGVKQIVGLEAALKKADVASGEHHIVLATEKKDVLGYVSVYVDNNKQLSQEIPKEEKPTETPESKPNEEQKEEVKNPNTKGGALFLMLVIAAWAIVLIVKKPNGIRRFS